jgi:hypothetical protein
MFAKVKVNPILWMQKIIFGAALDASWQEGFENGSIKARQEVIAMIRRQLNESSLSDFSNEELKLGYNVAQGVVLDILDGKR